MANGIRLESVSLGKGFVAWRVRYPALVKHKRELEEQYPRLADACQALKQSCTKDECDEETRRLVDEQTPGIPWRG